MRKSTVGECTRGDTVKVGVKVGLTSGSVDFSAAAAAAAALELGPRMPGRSAARAMLSVSTTRTRARC